MAPFDFLDLTTSSGDHKLLESGEWWEGSTKPTCIDENFAFEDSTLFCIYQEAEAGIFFSVACMHYHDHKFKRYV